MSDSMVFHKNSAGTGHSCLENNDVDPADTIKSRLRRAHPDKDEDEERKPRLSRLEFFDLH
jgi:hypothetical protein